MICLLCMIIPAHLRIWSGLGRRTTYNNHHMVITLPYTVYIYGIILDEQEFGWLNHGITMVF